MAHIALKIKNGFYVWNSKCNGTVEKEELWGEENPDFFLLKRSEKWFH